MPTLVIICPHYLSFREVMATEIMTLSGVEILNSSDSAEIKFVKRMSKPAFAKIVAKYIVNALKLRNTDQPT